MTKQILGIDLGTYNSAAAVLKSNGEVVAISSSLDRKVWKRTGESIKPFPSVVLYHPDGKVRAVGFEAKELAFGEPQSAIWGVKRLLGKTYKEALEHGELDRMLMLIEPDGENGRCMFMFEDRDIRPEEICAELLRHIRKVASEQLKTSFPDVVISVPAYFDAIAVGATVEAAKNAGFVHVDTIPEPVAAALAYDIQVTPRPQNFLVFDLGGGTLDVTAAEVWRTNPGPAGLSCRCRKNTGDTHLGGLDMDDRLVAQLAERMELGQLTDPERLQFRRAIEAAKVELSTGMESAIRAKVGHGEKTYKLTRFELEEALRSDPKDLISACEDQVRLAIKGADWKAEDVEHLLLVGGPTKMPCIREMLKGIFRRNPRVLEQIDRLEKTEDGGIDPMLAVCHGAAKSKGTNLTRIHPYGYGFVNERLLEEPGESMYRVIREPIILIPRDSVFPTKTVVKVPDKAFYRLDKLYFLEVIQRVPEAEQNVPGMGLREYRFLGEFQLAYRRDNFLMQVSMCLNENGELETTINNQRGSESATYVGVGSLQRHPIDLPTSQYAPTMGTRRKINFHIEEAEKVKQWGVGFQGFLARKFAEAPHKDQHVTEGLDKLRSTLTQWGAYPEQNVNDLYTVGMSLLHRSQEIRLITEIDRHRFEDGLEDARRQCYPLDEA